MNDTTLLSYTEYETVNIETEDDDEIKREQALRNVIDHSHNVSEAVKDVIGASTPVVHAETELNRQSQTSLIKMTNAFPETPKCRDGGMNR